MMRPGKPVMIWGRITWLSVNRLLACPGGGCCREPSLALSEFDPTAHVVVEYDGQYQKVKAVQAQVVLTDGASWVNSKASRHSKPIRYTQPLKKSRR